MPNRLIPEVIEEVSLVDEPANQRRFVVVKRLKSYLKDALEKLEGAAKAAPGLSLEPALAAVRRAVDAGENAAETLEALKSVAGTLEQAATGCRGEVAAMLSDALKALRTYLAAQEKTRNAKGGENVAEKAKDKKEPEQKAGPGAYYGPPMGYGYPPAYGYPRPYGVPANFRQAVADAITQIREALEDEDISDKAKGVVTEALAALEALIAKAEGEEAEKRGRKFSKENEDRIREIFRLAKELVDQIEALDEDEGKPWEQERESEYMAKCIELITEIANKMEVA